MKQELQKYLYNKYPKIFAEKDCSPEESCMAFGLECEDGWFFIIDNLCGLIQKRIDHPSYSPKKGWKFIFTVE